MAQRQGSRRKDRDRWTGITLAGQDVENHIGRMHAVADGLGAGRLDRRQPIGKHRGEEVDHLSIAVVSVGELAPHPFHRGWQNPVLEWRTVAQSAGLACKHRHVVPGIVDRLPAAEGASMFSDYPAVLADDDAIGIGLNLDRPTDRVSCHRVLVVVEAHQTSLGDRSRHGMNPSNRPA